jgi:hypothetical protein
MLFYFFWFILNKLILVSSMKTLEYTMAAVLTAFFILTFSSERIFTQDNKSHDAGQLFVKIEEGLNSSAVDKFSKYFSNKNYISLINGSNGYYSANQSYYVIKDFLSVFQPVSFKISNNVIDTNNPFASGVLKYNNKGIRGAATVFITLQFIDNQWRISQITIN